MIHTSSRHVTYVLRREVNKWDFDILFYFIKCKYKYKYKSFGGYVCWLDFGEYCIIIL